MINSKYCCYRHKAEGKHSKQCTYCLSHVPLGVINPEPPRKLPFQKNDPGLIVVASKPFRIQNRTHDHNEIQYRQTMPKRLTNPRIYIEKLLQKGQRSNPLLTTKLSSAHDYERILYFFQKIAKILQTKTKNCLRAKINQFLLQTGKSIKDRLLLIDKKYFINLLGSLFNFGAQDGEQFWSLAYRDGRFNSNDRSQQISLEAFIYNFQKYYVSTLNFTNMFSEAGLRQRLIDLRLALHDFKKNNIRMKLFLKWQGMEQKQFIEFADKNCGSEGIANRFYNEIELRDVTYLTMRTLAKTIYNLTDEKFLNYEKIEKTVVDKVKRIGQQLCICRKLMSQFIQNEQLYLDDEFQVTKILQYLKDDGVREQDIQIMVGWIRGIFKYLFFQKYKYQLNPIGLSYDFLQMKLNCQQILKISPKIVTEYDKYLKKKNDMIIFVLGDLMQNIDGAIAQMPVLQGPKKNIVECNYVTQSILRYLKNLHFNSFYRINTILATNRNLQTINDILTKRIAQNDLNRELKRMFSFSPNTLVKTVMNESQIMQTIQDNNNYTNVISHYNSIDNQLEMKIKKRDIIQKQEKQVSEGQKQNSNRQKSNKGENGASQEGKIDKNVRIQQRIQNSGWNCCSSRECCVCVSVDTKQSISTVENLESQLFDLLQM